MQPIQEGRFNRGSTFHRYQLEGHHQQGLSRSSVGDTRGGGIAQATLDQVGQQTARCLVGQHLGQPVQSLLFRGVKLAESEGQHQPRGAG
ncbi:hypothetical protein D3C81_1793040 [compost metagenome]